jgi:nicotinamide mononucleotide adenylyltransferase
MSKFTSIVDEALTKQQQADAGTTAAIAAAKAAEVAGKKDPTKKPSPVQRKLLQGLKKATMAAGKTLAKVAMQSNKPKGKVLEAEDDFVPRQGPETGGEFVPTTPDSLAQGEEPPAETEPLTTEGEVFYVNLARKSLFVDLDNADLNDAERQAITQDVHPENAKEIAKILRKVVSDYGLGESFDTKIDSLIEDLKKNDRVVVLVPGSFKPPHKGHYEMVRQYSETYSQGHVHVLISAPSANSERRTKDGKLITPAAAKQIFELYVQPLNNVTISVSEFPSPVTAAFESLKTLDPGTTVILGASKKDNDWKRWTSAQSWAEKEGLELDIANPEETAVDVVSNNIGRPYSASNIRDNFDNFEQIKTDIPEHVSPEEIKVIFDSL